MKMFLSKEILDEAVGFSPKGNQLLLMDGDAACYEAACTCAKLDTAVRRVHLKILEAMFLTDSAKAHVHITPESCKKAGRFNLIGEKPYQGNREHKNKPPMLEPLRQSIQGLLKDDNITIIPNYEVEADDGLCIEAYSLQNNEIVLWSADKDLRMVPCPYYDIAMGVHDRIDDPFGYLKLSSTEGGSTKVVGHGRIYFWFQLLAGDTADNVRGIRSYRGNKVGIQRAYDCLQEMGQHSRLSEDRTADEVIKMYKEIDQNILPEAYMLWLLRSPDDSFVKYLKELDITQESKSYINDCWKRKWRMQ